MKKYVSLLFLSLASIGQGQTVKQQYENLVFSKVSITDGFWKPHVDKITSVAIPVCIRQTEVETPRIRNFEIAAGLREGSFRGIFYDDSDVYKALEAMAYSLKNNPDKRMEEKADEWIDKIAKAQQSDGYINTYYTLTPKEPRWTDMDRHEAYCGGHLIEAGIAYYDATGKRSLLDVGIRFANHMDSIFGPGKRHWVPGHEEIEIALVKLFKITKDEKYLKLADWLLNERGHGHGTWKSGIHFQDDKPLVDQTDISGHAVRAMYLYTAAADVAALTGNTAYMNTMRTIWEDVVYRNMYLTGGIGSSRHNEGFTQDFDLPNRTAYCETCASVGMVFWNQRMGELTGESEYIDVLERSLYNGALDGISLKGDLFFYDNPLSSNGDFKRREWFGTACCPSNISRLLASLGDYIYGYAEKDIWVNLFVNNTATLSLKDQQVHMQIDTEYPWNGQIRMKVSPVRKKGAFTVRVRIPGWAKGEATPGNLYSFRNPQKLSYSLTVNGKPVDYTEDKGYLVINRTWKAGDEVRLELPMPVMPVVARQEVKSDRSCMALQRGPLIYCVEGADNNGKAWDIVLPENPRITISDDLIINEKVKALEIEAASVLPSPDGTMVAKTPLRIKAIPYYCWCNRNNSQMRVWLPTAIQTIKLNDEDTLYP